MRAHERAAHFGQAAASAPERAKSTRSQRASAVRSQRAVVIRLRPMNISKRGPLSIGVFLIGCATGGAASHYVATAAADPMPEGANKWAYLCFKDDSPHRIQEQANNLGNQGWELASSALSGGADMSSPIWCFKRRR